MTYYVSRKNEICESSRAETPTVLVTVPSSTLNLNVDFSGNTIQIARTTLAATNKIIDPARVTYKAGNSVMLNEGFEVKSGSIFDAKIGACLN